VQPEPPPVTIVDPNAPAGTADLLEGGRDPWRSSRKQLASGAMLVLVVALLSAAGGWVHHVAQVGADHRRLRALAAAEVAHVQLVLSASCCTVDSSSSQERLVLSVGNAGPDRVRLQSVDYGGVRSWVPGPEGELGLFPGMTVDLPVRYGMPCGPRAGRMAPSTMALHVQLPRGGRWVGTTTVDREGLSQVETAVRLRCGMQTPTEAVYADGVQARFEGRTIVMTYDVRNTSRTAMAVTAVLGNAGLRVTAEHMPLRLPPGGQNAVRGERLTVRVGIGDCRPFRAYQSQPSHEAAHLLLTVRGPSETQDVIAELIIPVQSSLNVMVDAQSLLRRWCSLPPEPSGAAPGG
jgi:hypothetical protein